MFFKKIELFSILGFRVGLDFSWFLLAILITWTLATGYFPQVLEGLDQGMAWALGVAGAVGLFISIIIHEFSHALVARQFDLRIRGITLFIFGGVAEMAEEPPNARAEFFMAIAGPIASYVLAGLFYGLAGLLTESTPAQALFAYLAMINAVLATFNLLPAFPLDGGRVFRAAVWWWTGDYAKATRRATFMGRLLGTFLLAMGVLSLVAGNVTAGIWQGLIGVFIIAAAASSEMQSALKTGLEGITVGRIMVADPVTVPAGTPLDVLVEDYFYRLHHKAFPVLRGNNLIGCVTLQDLGAVPPLARAGLTAGDIVSAASKLRIVAPDLPVSEALKLMRAHNTSRLMVVKDGALKGMLTMRDIMNFFAIHQELSRSG